MEENGIYASYKTWVAGNRVGFYCRFTDFTSFLASRIGFIENLHDVCTTNTNPNII